jgi:transcriptional regulator with GAF, ATPase, and Fis domain
VTAPVSVIFLSESGGLRASLAVSLLAASAPEPLELQTACLDATPWQSTTRALLHALDIAPITEPMPAQQLDITAFDLVVSLDAAAQRYVQDRVPRDDHHPLRLQWPGVEPEPHSRAFTKALAELEPRVADLLAQGLLATARLCRPAPTLTNVNLPPPNQPFHGLVARSLAMHKLFRSIRKAAQSDYPVMIQGETGTGKELVARALHQESPRNHKAFVAVNCGTLPEHLAESELFGHVKGAFTGAVKSRRGRFEMADGGTIFLDEVGDLPRPLQVKLLRVLQEHCFEPVGSEQSVKVDVRVVSATHRDLRQGVADGWFREDLYYRLCVLPLAVPPLRERREDIPDIAVHVMASIARETGRRFRDLTPQVLIHLQQYDWPGNVRELINVVQRAAVDASGDEINLAVLLPPPRSSAPRVDVPALARLPVVANAGHPLLAPRPGRGRKSKLEAAAVQQALGQALGNHSVASELLGVGRTSLYRFLRRHGLQ